MVIMAEISSLSPPLDFTKKKSRVAEEGREGVGSNEGRLLRPSYSVSLPIVIFLTRGRRMKGRRGWETGNVCENKRLEGG